MEKRMNSSIVDGESTWSKEENKLFERALAHVPENIPGRWDEIAKAVPGKTAEQVRLQFEALVHALDEIEAGRVEIPRYTDDYAKKVEAEFELRRNQINFGEAGSGSRHGEFERKKSTLGTEEEHSKPQRMATVKWTSEEDKVFENALVLYTEDAQNRWQLIAELLPGKTAEDVEAHYQLLLIDMKNIEAGLVPLPPFKDSSEEAEADSRKKRKKKNVGGKAGGSGGGKE